MKEKSPARLHQSCYPEFVRYSPGKVAKDTINALIQVTVPIAQPPSDMCDFCVLDTNEKSRMRSGK